MARKNKLKERGTYVAYRDYDTRLPQNGDLHEDVQALNRRESREVYHNMEMKRDMVNDYNYDRVQSVYSSFYAGLDPRRRQEMADGGMVHEDTTAMANLSPNGFQRQYPRAGYYANPFIDDSRQDESGEDE
jgi:hypothetical protein